MAVSLYQKIFNRLFSRFVHLTGREPQTPREWMEIRNDVVREINTTKGVPGGPKKPPFQGFKPEVIQGGKGIESLLESGVVKKGVAPKTTKETLKAKKDRGILLRDADEDIARIKRENKQAVKDFKEKNTPEVSGIDDILKSDFEVISGTSKKGKEISEKLGITARPGFPIKESGKADLKVVKTPKKDSLDIRLIKNFDQELDDIALAKEGYNLQEIGILKRARQVMKKEDQNPTDALRWTRGEMADEAGVDIDEFMTDFDWRDKYQSGGPVNHDALVQMYLEEGLSYEEAVQAAQSAANLPWDTLKKAEGGIIRAGFPFGGRALKAIMDAWRANKTWGVGGPPYKPEKTSFDIKSLTKQNLGQEFSLKELKEISESPFGEFASRGTGRGPPKFEEFNKEFKIIKARILKEKLKESKLHAEAMIGSAEHTMKNANQEFNKAFGPLRDKKKQHDMAEKITNQFTREGKKQLEEAKEGLKAIDIYMGTLQKKGRRLHQSGGLAYMLGEPTYMQMAEGGMTQDDFNQFLKEREEMHHEGGKHRLKEDWERYKRLKKYGPGAIQEAAGGGQVGHGPWTTGQTPPGPQPQPEMPQPQVQGQPNPMKAPRGIPSVAPRNMDPAYMQQQMMQQAMMGGMGQQRPAMQSGGLIIWGEEVSKQWPNLNESQKQYIRENFPQHVPEEKALGGRIGMMYGGDPGFAFEYGGSWADWHDQHRNAMPIEDYIKTKLPKERLPFRQNFSKGGMTRRAFMKLMSGLAALPFIGKGIQKTVPKVIPKATETIIERGADGIPKYAYDLIEVVKAKGTKEIMEGLYKRQPPSTKYSYKGVDVVEDGVGNTSVRKEQTKTGSWTDEANDDVLVDDYVDREVGFEIRRGEEIVKDEGLETQKAIQAPDEYSESTAYMQGDPEGGIDVSEITEVIDDVDHLDLKEIADEIKDIRSKKASGGLAHMLGE